MTERLNLNAVRVFITVVMRGSFSAAGRALDLPTSNVSRHIYGLEQTLQVKLLDRPNKPLRLTEAGEALFKRFYPSLDHLDDFVDSLRLDGTCLQGRLNISLPNEIGPLLLGAALSGFANQHPKLALRCVITWAGLGNNQEEIDLAVILGRGYLPNSHWVAKPLAELESVVVAAPALIARHGRPTHIKELAHLPCITTANALGGSPWKFQSGNGRITSQSVQARIRLDSGTLALCAARQGVGYAILVKSACQDELHTGQLEVITLDKPAAPLRLFAAYPQRRNLAKKVRALMVHFAAITGLVALIRAATPRQHGHARIGLL